MRYIDADALMETVREHDYPLVAKNNSWGNGMFTTGIQQAIDEQPTADVAPVVHGAWIAEQKNAEYCEFCCSACDFSVGQTDQFDETEVKEFREWYKYCPSCGAKMDGGT